MFQKSTQQLHWHFTSTELKEMRLCAHKKSLVNIENSSSITTTTKKYRATDSPVPIPFDESFCTPNIDKYELFSPVPSIERTPMSDILECNFNSADVGSPICIETPTRVPQRQKETPLDFEEEQALFCWFIEQLMNIGTQLNLRFEIISTAVAFLKRFFLRTSLMDYYPPFLFGTCIYVASKAEDMPIDLEVLSKSLSCTVEDIIIHEISLLAGIHFHLQIHHPYKPLRRFLEEIDADSNFSKQAIQLLHLNTCISDALFMFAPAQIALATLTMAQDEIGEERYINSIPNINHSRLNPIIASIISEFKRAKERSYSVPILISMQNRARTFCIPLNDPSSQEFQSNLEKENSEKDARRYLKNSAKVAESEARFRQLIAPIEGRGNNEQSEFVIKRHFVPRNNVERRVKNAKLPDPLDMNG